MTRSALCVVVLLLTGCGSASDLVGPGGSSGLGLEAPVPTGPPSIRGVVTAIDAGGRVVVEAVPADSSGSDKAVIRLTPDTRVVDSAGRAMAREALMAGITVSAWFTGPVAESYPVQASAAVVVIETP